MRHGRLGWGLAIVACGSPTDQDGASGGTTDGLESASGDDATETTGRDVGDDTGDGDGTAGDDVDPDDTAADDDGGPPLLDVGNPDEPAGCGCGSELGFSYIWVADGNGSTLSKINTVSMEEEGRYLTRSDGAGSPSRTSVSLSGRLAAVNNRHGGVLAVWSSHDDCDPERNGEPGLQTSQGADDVRAWGDDDCVAWTTDFDYGSQRPIAWVAGERDPETCAYQDEKLWTSGCTSSQQTWVRAHLLSGETGEVEETVEVVGMACEGIGGYGGAADGQGNFWLSNKPPNGSPALLARVDRETLDVQTWPAPVRPYGITVDHTGRPWISASMGKNTGHIPELTGPASAARFDPETETWALAQDHVARGEGGIVEDASGTIWMSYWFGYDYDGTWGIAPIDAETLSVGAPVVLPAEAGRYLNGISVDVDGRLWITAIDGPVSRYDPATGASESYLGLDYTYSYSDMTGWALQNAACTPEG